MSAALDAEYRRALRWYPARWRAENADVVIGTLLDIAEAEGRQRPSALERIDLALNGVGVRINGWVSARAMNAVSSIAIATGVAFAAWYLVVQLWSPWARPAVNVPHDLGSFGPFVSPGALVCLAWLAVGASLLAGGRRVARIILAIIPVGALALLILSRVAQEWWGPTAGILELFAALAVLGQFGIPWSRPRLALAIPAAAVAISALYWPAVPWMLRGPLYYGDHLMWTSAAETWAPLPAVAIGVVIVALGATGRATAAQVLLVSIVPWLVADVLMRYGGVAGANLGATTTAFYALGYGAAWVIAALVVRVAQLTRVTRIAA